MGYKQINCKHGNISKSINCQKNIILIDHVQTSKTYEKLIKTLDTQRFSLEIANSKLMILRQKQGL